MENTATETKTDDVGQDQIGDDGGGGGGGDHATGPEDKARAMGWAPREEWRGSDDRWVDAQTFLDRTTRPGVAAERLDKVTTQLAEVTVARERDRQAFEKRFDTMERMNTVAMDIQKQEIIKQYEGLKRQAVDDADTERYDALNKAQSEEVAKLDETAKQVVDGAGADGQGQDADAGGHGDAGIPQIWQDAIGSWRNFNQWYGADKTLTQYASFEHVRLQDEEPGLTPEENLQKVRDLTAARFPDKFGRPPTNGAGDDDPLPPRRNAPAAEGGNRGGGSTAKSNRKKGLQDLRREAPEAVASGERFVKQGLFKDLDAYAERYFEQEELVSR